MPAVTKTLLRPDGTPWTNQVVQIGVAGSGYVAGSDAQVVSITQPISDPNTGQVSATLQPSNPGECYVWTDPDGRQWPFQVPTSGGPFSLLSLLVSAPTVAGLVTAGVSSAQLSAAIAALELGSASQQPTSAFDTAGAAASVQTAAQAFTQNLSGLGVPELYEMFGERGTHQMVTGDVAPTGQAYTVTGDAGGSLYTGQLPSNGQTLALCTVPGTTGAWYLLARLAGARGLCGGVSSRWRTGGTTSNGNVTIGLFDSASNFAAVNAQIHATVGEMTTQVSKVVNGSVVPLIPVGHTTTAVAHKTVPLLADSNTSYNLRYMIDPVGQRAAVRTPDGSILHYADPCFALACPFAFVEGISTQSSDSTPEILSWYSDSSQVLAI